MDSFEVDSGCSGMLINLELDTSTLTATTEAAGASTQLSWGPILSPISFFLLYYTKKRENLTSFIVGNSNILLQAIILF